MNSYLLNRFFCDVSQRYHSPYKTAESISFQSHQHIIKPSKHDLKELVNISLDMLCFKKNAIETCEEFLNYLQGITCFFATLEEGHIYLRSLEEIYPSCMKEFSNAMQDDMNVLSNKYKNVITCDSIDDECKYIKDPQLPSEDEQPLELTSGVLQDMKNQLGPTNATSIVKTDAKMIAKSGTKEPDEAFNKNDGSKEDVKNFVNSVNKVKASSENTSVDLAWWNSGNEVATGNTLIASHGAENELEVLDCVPNDDELSSFASSEIVTSDDTCTKITRISSRNSHLLNLVESCHVRISSAERNKADKIAKQGVNQTRSSTDESTKTSVQSSIKRIIKCRAMGRQIYSTSSSSSEDNYRPPSYENSDDSDNRTQICSDRRSDNNTNPSNAISEDDIDSLAEIPNEYSDFSSTSDSSVQSPKKRKKNDTDDDRAKIEVKSEGDGGKGKSKLRLMWDPLLKKLKKVLVSSSDEEDTKNRPKRRKRNTYRETNSSDREPATSNRLKLKKKFTLNSSEDNSDVEFISIVNPLQRQAMIQPKKGRKNIRDIISAASLSSETQAVQEEERERRQRLQIKNSNSQVEDFHSDFVLDNNPENQIKVHPALANGLLKHQRAGVQFMWDNCYESVERLMQGDQGSGCILAHCMGLGKTRQVVTLVMTLASYFITRTSRILILCPLSTVNNWENEFADGIKKTGSTALKIYAVQASNFSSRYTTVREWNYTDGVLIMAYDSYKAFLKRTEKYNYSLIDPGPDLVVCDEGHLLKTVNSHRTQIISSIKTKRRIILTGTPMQNNLDEYYTMVGFIKPNFFGTKEEYRNRFVNPIVNGQYENSTYYDIQRMKKRSHVLHKMTKHFIQRFEESELRLHLPRKCDYVVKLELNDVQINLAKKFKDICNHQKLFANLVVFRAIATHPYLLQMQADAKAKNDERKKTRIRKATDKSVAEELLLEHLDEIDADWWKTLVPDDLKVNIEYGSKLVVMMAILKEAMARNEKLLIFSVSLLELDLIERFLKESDPMWMPKKTYFRLDGGVDNETRTKHCKMFNMQTNGVKLMLLTHKVGGLGLNLTSANRVIIMDTSWNPADDTQSIFRIYRLGQQKTCYVYRLIAKGMMEEVIYERAVTKQAIAGRVVDEMQISRHFQEQDLEAMYRCNVDRAANKPMTLPPQDTLLANLIKRYDCIYTYQDHKELLQNRPDEELNESELELAWEEYEREKNFPPAPYPIGQVPNDDASIATNDVGLPGSSNPQPNSATGIIISNIQSGENVGDIAIGDNKQEIIQDQPSSSFTPLTNLNRTILFDSPVRGGKVLARHSEGRILNDLDADKLTVEQVRAAEKLLKNPENQQSNAMYVIKANGNFRTSLSNPSELASVTPESALASTSIISETPQTATTENIPRITGSINLVEE